MTQEEKDLLLKDLSSRLPYKTEIQVNDWAILTTTLKVGHISRLLNEDLEIKPYLFPLSSMTEEEISDLQKINSQFCFDTFDNFAYVGAADDGFCSVEEMSNILNYLNSHHFDYLGLIEKGLAIKVTEENNPYNITEE